jgi:hypothetical protein
MIKPTVGRKVWYYPSAEDKNGSPAPGGQPPMEVNSAEPLDATVVAVWGDRCVNLAIFDIHGALFARRSVRLLQDDDAVPEFGRYATWIPYQVAQAAKATT